MATDQALGGVKIGEGINIDSAGTISVSGGSGVEVYTCQLEAIEPENFSQDDIANLEALVEYLGDFDPAELPPARLFCGGYFYDLRFVEVVESVAVGYRFIETDMFDSNEKGVPYMDSLYVPVDDVTGSTWLYYDGQENGQMKYEVEDDEQRDGLDASEGDICVVLDHWGEATDFYDYLSMGYNLFDCFYYVMNKGYHRMQFTLDESEYFESGDEAPAGEDFHINVNWQYNDYYGIRCYFDESDQAYYWQTYDGDDSWSGGNLEVGDEYEMPIDELNGFGYNNGNDMFIWSGNTSYQYGLRAKVWVEQVTYQFNNGSWIKIASADELKEVKETAESAYNTAQQKLSWGTPYFGTGTDPISVLRYNGDGVYNIHVNGVGQGLLIHEYDTDDDNSNKYVRELVTSQSVLKLVSITQDDYDQLVNDGDTDPNTLYVIIPDPNV